MSSIEKMEKKTFWLGKQAAGLVIAGLGILSHLDRRHGAVEALTPMIWLSQQTHARTGINALISTCQLHLRRMAFLSSQNPNPCLPIHNPPIQTTKPQPLLCEFLEPTGQIGYLLQNLSGGLIEKDGQLPDHRIIPNFQLPLRLLYDFIITPLIR